MSIWKRHAKLSAINALSKNTMAAILQIEFTEIGDRYLKATMPVTQNVHQPYGLLHGGASAALAETIGSVASWLSIEENQWCVGMEINANHIKAKRNGFVTAIATPLHLGASTHVWDIKIVDEKEHLICVSRLTVAVIKNKDQ